MPNAHGLNLKMCHRIIECLELKAAHIIKSNFWLSTGPLVNESILSTLPTSLVSLLHTHHAQVKNLFLASIWPSPDTAPCRSLGPCHCHREQSSALPLHSLWGAVAAMRPPLSSSPAGLFVSAWTRLKYRITIIILKWWFIYNSCLRLISWLLDLSSQLI